MYKRALAGYEKALEPDHTSKLDTVNNLGLLNRDQRKMAEAEEMYYRALVGYKKALGHAHTLTLDSVNNLGSVHYKQGKMAEAEEIYHRALIKSENILSYSSKYYNEADRGLHIPGSD